MSIQPKFTPGPWVIETYHGSFFKIVRALPDDALPQHRLEADAALIEQAPEMYEFSDNVTSFLADLMDPHLGLLEKLKLNERAKLLFNDGEKLLSKSRGGL